MNESSNSPALPTDPVAALQALSPADVAVYHGMATDALARGLSLERVNGDLAAAGAPPLPEAKPADPTLSPQAAEIDAAFPAAKPTDYAMPAYAKFGEQPTAEHLAFDTAARGWLAEGLVPKPIGDAVAADLAQFVPRWEAMSTVDRQICAAGELATATKVLGADAAAKIGLARQLVKEIEAKRPGLVAYLESSGAGNSSSVIVQLAQHAERLLARRKATR